MVVETVLRYLADHSRSKKQVAGQQQFKKSSSSCSRRWSGRGNGSSKLRGMTNQPTTASVVLEMVVVVV